MEERLSTVFLSGTRKDLAPFYRVAKLALEVALPHCEVRLMEDAEPEDIPGDHWSRREATKPDVLVGLIGHYYGTVLRGQSRSLTEQEFDVAAQVGIDRLMFLTEAGDPSAARGQNARAAKRTQRFRKKINGRVRSVAAARLGTSTSEYVMSELVAASSNGGRWGTPGKPTTADLAMRDGARAIAAKYPSNGPVASLYEAIARNAEQTIEVLRKLHEEASLSR